MCGANTFFTAFSFVSWVADTGPHDACAMVIAGDIDALVGWDITFRSLPAAVAQAPSLHVLPVSTAQHRAGCWGQIIDSASEQSVHGYHFSKDHRNPEWGWN